MRLRLLLIVVFALLLCVTWLLMWMYGAYADNMRLYVQIGATLVAAALVGGTYWAMNRGR